MAELTIRLVANPKTGKRDIFIDYESEDDSLPIEHEDEHRDIVEQLLGQGVLDPDDVGQIKVQRVRPELQKTGEEDQAHEREAAASSE